MMRSTLVVIRKCLIFESYLGNGATKAIKMNLTNVLRVYKEILRYYKEYGEKKSPENNYLDKNNFHQRKRLK